MQSTAPIRLATAAGFALSMVLTAQSPPVSRSRPPAAIPASSTTASAIPPTPVTTQPPSPLQLPARRAVVTYSDGSLSVSANNSSLNQILREVSRMTGITISGGVAEERVFGQYGPAVPSRVLGTLLDGTASNMLFVQATAVKPAELILTPRLGVPTPPNPNASASEDADPSDPSDSSTPAPARPVSAQPLPANSEKPNPFGSATPAPTPATDQPQSPNGVNTPQQIYDQLQRLRQQQGSTPQ